MRLFEVAADGLVVLGGTGGALFEPGGEAFVQLGPRALEQPAVSRVADQRVMEAQRRVAEKPAGIGFDQLAAAMRVQPRVEAAAVVQQRRHGRARELAADDRRPLQHGALARTEAFDARGQQRVDRGRHLERRDLDVNRPVVARAPQHAVLHEHADQLAHEERIAFTGGEHAPRHGGRQSRGADHPGRESRGGTRVEPAQRDHVRDQRPRHGKRGAHLTQLRNPDGYSWANMTVGDIDNDGSPEVHVVLPRGRTGTEVDRPLLYVYEFDGSTFPAEPSMTSTLTVPDGYRYSSSSVTVANVDADADMELLVTSRNDDFGGASAGRTMMIFSLIGEVGPCSSVNREFADSSAVLKGGYVFTAYTLDYDRDGKTEVWVPTWDMLSMAIYEQTGADSYALQADINEATTPDDVGEHNGVRFYDADGDGAKEMYWSAMSGDGENPGGVYYIKSTSDVSTLTIADVALVSPLVDSQNGNACAGADVGDIDSDGRMDFVCTGAIPINKIFRLEYNGSGSPGDVNSYTWTTLYEEALANVTYDFENVSIGDDLDGDGNREVLIANLVLKPGGNDPAIIILEA